MSKINLSESYINDLHQTLKDFIADLSEIFTQETERGDLALIDFFYGTLEKEIIMKHAIEKFLPYKNYIVKRDINFFDKNRSMFAGLPEDRMNYYSNIIVGQKRLSEDDLDACWRYLDTIIACVESYQKATKIGN